MYSKQDPSADWDAYCADREAGVCEICNKVHAVCREDGCNGNEKVAENTTYLLDEYPAKQYFSTRKIKSGDTPCKCGWYHSDGFMCPKNNKSTPVINTEHYSLHGAMTSDDYIKGIEEKVNDMYKVYDPTVAKNATLDDKCRRFVKIEPFDWYMDNITIFDVAYKLQDCIYTLNELVDAVNELKEQSK